MTETELKEILKRKNPFYIWDPRYCDVYQAIEIIPKELKDGLKISVCDGFLRIDETRINRYCLTSDYIYERELEYIFKDMEEFYKFTRFDEVDIVDTNGRHFLVDINEFKSFVGALSDISDILNQLDLPKNEHIYKRWNRKIELVDEEKQTYNLSFVKR